VGEDSDVVLLVDADDVNRAVVSRILATHRYGVAGVGTGAEGLRILAAGPPPCLILYVMTGTEDGSREFRAAQLAEPAFAAVPTIMCTAMDFEADKPTHPKFIAALLGLVSRHCEAAAYAN
jgi:CheY-like chemotaxis protein